MKIKFQHIMFDIFCNILIEDMKTPLHYDYMEKLNLLGHAVCISAMSGERLYKYVKISKDGSKYHACYGIVSDNGNLSSLTTIDYLMYSTLDQVRNFIKSYRLNVPVEVCEHKTLIKIV